MDDNIFCILVEGLHDQNGDGYFRAFLEAEADENKQPKATAVCSTSRMGLYMAVANLCKRLDKRVGSPFPPIPAKWQVYFVNEKTGQVPLLRYGYLLVDDGGEYAPFVAHLMSPPYSFLEDEDTTKMEEYVHRGWLNSVQDAAGQTGFGALGNLCRKFHYYGYSSMINSVILDPLATAFFLPAALE
jgi:hypothetical protein